MSKTVDKLNIGLILVSALLAYLFPLELFIFAYAILGPLHYVTEINWLNNKSYYFTNKRWVWFCVGLISSIVLFVPKLYFEYGNLDSTLGDVMVLINSWSNSVLFISLLLAAGYQFISSKLGWIAISVIGVLGSILLRDLEAYNVIIGLFVPTIIHVYVFTLIFMFYGALKAKSRLGYLTVILAILVPFVFVNVPIEHGQYLFPDALKDVYLANNFHVTPVLFSKFLGLSDGTSFFFYESMELKLMMFMSFIYCYHYLNWFSKTTVIKWHKTLNLKKSIVIIAIWVVSLGLYYIDFTLGFLTSLFLSFMHVILEFPLNLMSIKGILVKTR